MAKKIRVTSRTDTRGTVNQDYRGLYEVQALKAAKDAGVPAFLLDAAGWNGDEDDIEGYWAHLVYEIGDVSFVAPNCVERLSDLIGEMHTICRNVGVSPVEAMEPVYDMAKFKRQLHQGFSGMNAVSEDLDLFGAPSGPEHDSHAHGLARGAWICFPDKD